LSDCAIEAAEAAGLPVHRGRLATVAEVLWRAEEKRRIAASTHAIGVDMESGVLGRWASERQIPFVVVRAVTDVLDEDLPLDFNLFLHPSRWAKGALACVLRPSCVFDLNRLRKQTIVASERLTRFLKRFFDTLR
jgi:adenosylhomocysteine nucleosidase